MEVFHRKTLKSSIYKATPLLPLAIIDPFYAGCLRYIYATDVSLFICIIVILSFIAITRIFDST